MSLLQGQELYSTSITPHNPNLQFDMQVSGALQQKYDAGYERASILYGSIVNPQLSRMDTQQAKEEYLKAVEQDLRRVGKIDFSISENVTAAQNLFKGMWTNKLLLKDAQFTQNYKQELNKAEGFKNCLDPSKCGGQYWDEGVKYINYKRQEFINADTDTAMNFSDVSYIPYNSVMEKAIKTFKDSGISFKFDKLSSDGKYMITTKNGEDLRSPLTLLFSETIAKDPRLMDMFRVKSYVDRKDWTMSKVQSGEFANESEANVNYLNSVNNRTIQALNEQAYNLGVDSATLNDQLENLKAQHESTPFNPNSAAYKRMVDLQNLKNNSDNALVMINNLKMLAENKNKAGLNVMIDAFDNENAYNYFNDEIRSAVEVLMFKDFERTLKVDEYAMEEVKFSHKLKEMERQHSYNISLEREKTQQKKDFEDYKELMGHKDYNSGSSNQDLMSYNEAESAVYKESANMLETIKKEYAEKHDGKLHWNNYSINEIRELAWTNDKDAVEAIKKYELALSEKKKKANKAAEKIGNPIKHYEEVSSNLISRSDFINQQNLPGTDLNEKMKNLVDLSILKSFYRLGYHEIDSKLHEEIAKKFINSNDSKTALTFTNDYILNMPKKLRDALKQSNKTN